MYSCCCPNILKASKFAEPDFHPAKKCEDLLLKCVYCNVIDSPKTMLQILKDLPDVYTRVSSFLAWINATILSNGGLASCNFSLTAEPSQGRIKSRNYININLIQDQSVPLSTLVLYNTVQSLNKKCTLLLTGHSA